MALSATPVQAASGGHVVCFDDPPPADLAECKLSASAETDAEGRLVVELAAGGGGWADQCRRTNLVIADASEGPEWVDCDGGEKGWYSQRHDCYFTADDAGARNKDPDDTDVIYPEGLERGDDGTVYLAYCYFEHYTAEWGWFRFGYWFLPPGDEPGPTEDPTAGLIVEALDNLELYAPAIGTAPPVEGAGLVRLPVWLWNQTDENNWGTRDAQASEAGITAEATAEATEIVWDMGDGSEVTCDEGVAWELGMDTYNPPCGHPYSRTSRDEPDGTYTITAVTTWEVEWSVTGPGAASGTLTLHPQATVELEVNEIQVLTGPR